MCLLFAGSATAATWTVDPLQANSGACDPVSHACKTIAQANASAKSGDTILIKDGTFAEKPQVFLQSGLTIKSEHPGRVVWTIAGGSAGDPAITIGPGADASPTGAGDGTGLDGLIVTAPGSAGPTVEINAKNVALRNSTFQHAAGGAGAADAPVVEGDPDVTGGQTSMTRVSVFQSSGTTGAVTASNVLTVADSVIATLHGYGVRYDGGVAPGLANTLLRSQVFTSDANANAVEVASGTQASRVYLNVDSSILAGGPGGAGILARSGKLPNANSQAISVSVIRGTVAGAAKSAIADAQPAADQLLFHPGDVFITFDQSIVRGPAQGLSGTTMPGPTGYTTTASVDIIRSDTNASPAANVTVGASTNTPESSLFVNPGTRDFHLRGDAPVIDKGESLAAGESDTDVDGDPRVVGSSSDLGADESANHAPVARFVADATTISAGQTIAFDATSSSDPDEGDHLAEYRWEFGDGETAATGSPQITHAYANVGTFDVKLIVADSHGAVSEVQQLTVTVSAAPSLESVRPQVSITRPRAGQRISHSRRLTIAGRATDEDGIHRVEVSIRLVKRSRARRANRDCLFVLGSRLTRRPCSQRPILSTTRSGETWRYRAPQRLRLPRGLYTVTVRATDKLGIASRTVKRTFRIT